MLNVVGFFKKKENIYEKAIFEQENKNKMEKSRETRERKTKARIKQWNNNRPHRISEWITSIKPKPKQSN